MRPDIFVTHMSDRSTCISELMSRGRKRKIDEDWLAEMNALVPATEPPGKPSVKWQNPIAQEAVQMPGSATEAVPEVKRRGSLDRGIGPLVVFT